MSKTKRLIAFVTALVFAVVLTSSILFVAEESKHECSGIDCHICEQVSHCLHFFDNFTPDPHVYTAASVAVFAVVWCIGFAVISKKLHTLVNLKVKLSD